MSVNPRAPENDPAERGWRRPDARRPKNCRDLMMINLSIIHSASRELVSKTVNGLVIKLPPVVWWELEELQKSGHSLRRHLLSIPILCQRLFKSLLNL